MENTRFLIILAVCFSLSPYSSHAYKAETTHRSLTSDVVRFYEYFYPNTFVEDERLSIEKGAVGEDAGVRALNHFFDPVYNKAIVPAAVTSKVWSLDTSRQANSNLRYAATLGNITNVYFSSPDDYSWDRSIYEYAHGDKKRGLEGLGHILHLIEDATVPDHTRGDRHPDFIGNNILGQESPYEIIASSFNIENIRVSQNLIRENKRPVLLPSLGEYFDTLAKYSNSNFFSQNTISEETNKDKSLTERVATGIIDTGFYDGKYPFPFVQWSLSLKDSRKIGYFDGHPIVGFYEIPDRSLIPKKKYFLNDSNNLILTDYWNLLSRQAVQHGAGVVKLFFDEVEKEKKTLALYNKNKSLLGRAVEGIASTLAFSGRGGEQSAINLASIAAAFPEEAVVTEESAQAEGGAVPEEPAAQEDIEPEIIVDTRAVEVSEPTENLLEKSLSAEDVTETTLPPDTLPYPGFGGGGSATLVSSDTEAPATPTITAPASFSATFTSASVSFSGTAEANATVTIAYASGGATTTSTATAAGGSWSFSDRSLPQGVTAVALTATDSAGNTSGITWATLTVDSTAPTFSSFSVAECASSLSVTGCLTTSTTLALSWNSSATDIAEYRITKDYATVSTQTATTAAMSLSNGTYSIAVVAVDTAGNVATSTAQSVEVVGLPIVLSEVAWSGTSASASDEWIELFNPTSKNVSLSGWVVYAGDGTPYIPLSGTIAAGGYYLIERDDDTTVSPAANLSSPFTGTDVVNVGLQDTGEDLYLARLSGGATTTIDSRTKCGSNWCGGTSATRYSMERYGNTQSELAENSWGSTLGEFILNGTAVDGNIVKGTPGRKNSLSYQLTKMNTLTVDKTILATHSPYLVGRDGFTVNAGTTLTIESGVVIKVVNANAPSVTVNGTLVANGTSGSPVVFTSFLDDTYGGDMNGDGSATTPAAGDWRQLIFTSTGGSSSLTNTLLRYGGNWSGTAPTYKGIVAAVGVSTTLNAVTVEHSMKHGLVLSNATSTVTNSTFRHNTNDSSSYAVTVGGGSLTMSGSTVSNSSNGISIGNATTVSLSNMTFSANTYYDIVGSGSPTVTCTSCGTPTTSPANLIQ